MKVRTVITLEVEIDTNNTGRTVADLNDIIQETIKDEVRAANFNFEISGRPEFRKPVKTKLIKSRTTPITNSMSYIED